MTDETEIDPGRTLMLAVKEGGGKLGGVPVNVRVEDDALKPANAKQIADKMVQSGVRLFTGINFSNVMAAVGPTPVALARMENRLALARAMGCVH